MISKNASRISETVELAFHSVRNVSSPEDIKNERKVFVSQIPVQSIVSLGTNENVRGYLVEAEGKQKRYYSSVHKAIRETLTNDPQNFNLLNSGLTIVARDIKVDEGKKTLLLTKASIVNGSQTQGVISDVLNAGYGLEEVHIKCEIMIVNDDDLVAEISIARNFQNDVMLVSIAGRRGYFDEMEQSLQTIYPKVKLRKSETEWAVDNVIDSEKLLQVITALIPDTLWPRVEERENPNKVYTYSMKARCLKEFQSIYEGAHDVEHSDHIEKSALYNYYIDIAPHAYGLYIKWKAHQGFKGTRLLSIKREGRTVTEVPDGIIFPIISSLSVFASVYKRKWILDIPHDILDHELIKTAKTIYQEIASSNPQTMGKSKACYTSLLQITRLYKKLTSGATKHTNMNEN
jgi:hypothetical protein